MPGTHPALFGLLGVVAAAETGLLAYLVNQFEGSGYPAGQGEDGSPNEMKSYLYLLLFTGAWTTLFALVFTCFVQDGLMASIGAAVVWLIITVILWAVGAAKFHQIRFGGQCEGEPTVSLCRQLEAVEALAWTALGLTILCLIGGLFTYRARRYNRTAGYRV